mgnify:CR=1 FL=1
MNKEDKIAVLGASGLVGSAIVRRLLEKGYRNIVGTYKTRKPEFEGIELFQVDLTNQKETEKFFEQFRPEYVFFAAAKVGGIFANNTYKADFIYENITISSNVIHASYKFGVKKLLNLGSSCIYPKFAPQPMKEEHLLTGSLEPTNEPYAIAKIAAIKLCRYYNEQYGTNFISIMPTNLYGPYDNFDLYTSHVMPALIRKFHLGKCLEEDDIDAIRKDLDKTPIEGIDGKASKEEIMEILRKYGITKNAITLWGSGEVYREFLYIDDLADACIFLMEKMDAEDMKRYSPDYFINVGTGEDLTVKELARVIKDIVGFKGNIMYDKSKPDGTPRKLLDVTKIKELGWNPKIGLGEGIRRTYEWYLSGRL